MGRDCQEALTRYHIVFQTSFSTFLTSFRSFEKKVAMGLYMVEIQSPKSTSKKPQLMIPSVGFRLQG